MRKLQHHTTGSVLPKAGVRICQRRISPLTHLHATWTWIWANTQHQWRSSGRLPQQCGHRSSALALARSSPGLLLLSLSRIPPISHPPVTSMTRLPSSSCCRAHSANTSRRRPVERQSTWPEQQDARPSRLQQASGCSHHRRGSSSIRPGAARSGRTNRRSCRRSRCCSRYRTNRRSHDRKSSRSRDRTNQSNCKSRRNSHCKSRRKIHHTSRHKSHHNRSRNSSRTTVVAPGAAMGP